MINLIIYLIPTVWAVVFGYLSEYLRADQIKQQNSSKYIKPNKKFALNASNFFLTISCLSLFLTSALRWEVGTDWGIYRYGFNQIASGQTMRWEKGYIYLNKIVLLFTDNISVIIALTSLIFIVFVYQAIHSIAINRGLCILFLVLTGFYFHSFNGIRQWISLAIFIYAIKHIKNKHFWAFLFWIIVASTIHSSAIIFIPLYFYCKIEISLQKAFLILLLFMIGLPFIGPVYEFIISNTKYSFYLGTIYNIPNFSLTDFILGFLLLVLGYIYYNQGKNTPYYTIFLNLQIAAFIVSLYSSVIFLADRIMPCFTVTQFLFIPLILDQEKNIKIKHLLTFILIAIYSITIFYTFGILGWSDILPYKSIFCK